MSIDGCPRIDDAASYVLYAMPDDDSSMYELHVRDCQVCTDKIAELQFITDALLSGVPQLQAPSAIRGRVMSVVHAEAELLRAAGASADRPVQARSSRRLGGFSMRLWPATALACALLALGIGGGALLTGGNGADTRDIRATVTAPGAAALVRVATDSLKLDVSGMPAPPEGRIYQVWLDPRGDRGPEPTQALFSVNSDGQATVAVPGDLDDVEAVLVTDEPLGGSEVPTRQPVIQAKLA